MMERGVQPTVGTDRELTEGWLDFQRATLANKCEGLSKSDLHRQAVPPSGLSLARLVRHLADMENMDVSVLRGEPVASLYPSSNEDAEPTPENGMYDWSVYDVEDEALVVWSDQVERLKAALAGFQSLEDHLPDPYSALTVRSVVMHLVMEYARHNGHADLLREHLDGRVGY